MNLKSNRGEDECVDGKKSSGRQCIPREVLRIDFDFDVCCYPAGKCANGYGDQVGGEALIEDRCERSAGVDGNKSAEAKRNAQHRKHSKQSRLIAAGYPQ